MGLPYRLSADIRPCIGLDETGSGHIVRNGGIRIGVTVPPVSSGNADILPVRSETAPLLTRHDISAPDEIVEPFEPDDFLVGGVGQRDGFHFICFQLERARGPYHDPVILVTERDFKAFG